MATQETKKRKTTSSKSIPKPKSAVKKSTKAKTTSQKRETTKVTRQTQKFGDTILDEVILILIIAGSVVTLISMLSEKMGVIGNFLNAFMKGLFGIGGLFLPTFVIGFCVWMLSVEDRKGMTRRIVASVIFLLCISMIAQAMNFSDVAEGQKFLQKMSSLYKHGSFTNGGLFGGLFGGLLMKSFGRIGCILLLLVLLLISFIMGTGKSFFRFMESLFERRYEYEDDDELFEEEDDISYEEEKQLEPKREKPFAKKKRKKGDFNIRICERSSAPSEAEIPVVEATVFRKTRKRTLVTRKEPIYDYVKEVAEPMPQEEPKQEMSSEEMVTEFVNDNVHTEESAFFEPEIHGDFVLEEEPQDTIEPEESTQDNSQWEEEQSQADASENMEMQPEISQENTSSQLDQHSLEEELQPAKEEVTPKNEELMEEVEEKETKNLEQEPKEQPYIFPPMDLLGKSPKGQNQGSKTEMLQKAHKLEETLKSFGVVATVIQINKGPTVTRYELSPSQGVKVSKIVNLADDIALNLAASGIRIEAPIPGKAAVGIEVPNKETQSVYLRSVLESQEFHKFPSKLAFALGEDIAGNPVVTDIAKMPHLLIAGATGSGKSVCINTLITSILYKADPKEVKLLLVDPKVVELSVYNGIPHLLIPVVTDPKKASAALNWAVREMLARYNDFAENNVRDIKGFNAMKREKGELEGVMPQIVIIIDELADLMMAAPGEVEDSICRLAQMARAAGMHLIIATQRPSVDVITGVIKANIPSRLAFAVSSGVDSRTILDMVGAEKLLGKGDMLFYPSGMSKPVRVQGAFVTDKEVENIVSFVKGNKEQSYDQEMIEKITTSSKNAQAGEESDEFFDAAVDLVVEKEKASVSMLQRQFRIGYNRAARMMDDLERRGIVGQEEGSKPRKVLLTKEELYEMRNPNNGNE